MVKSISAWEILDSRGRPTLKVSVTLSDGCQGAFAVPSGASVGSNEALELRDGDPERYGGQGVLRAVDHVNTLIAGEIVGQDFATQADLIWRCAVLMGLAINPTLVLMPFLGHRLPMLKREGQAMIYTSTWVMVFCCQHRC